MKIDGLSNQKERKSKQSSCAAGRGGRGTMFRPQRFLVELPVLEPEFRPTETSTTIFLLRKNCNSKANSPNC